MKHQWLFYNHIKKFRAPYYLEIINCLDNTINSNYFDQSKIYFRNISLVSHPTNIQTLVMEAVIKLPIPLEYVKIDLKLPNKAP